MPDLTQITPANLSEVLPFLSERGQLELDLAVERWRSNQLAAALAAQGALAEPPSAD